VSAWTPEVVEVRADSPEGWAHLVKEFGALHGRPICRPEQPVLAIYGRISPTRLGWAHYCRADDTEAILRLREAARAEAWKAAATTSDESPELAAKVAAAEAELAASWRAAQKEREDRLGVERVRAFDEALRLHNERERELCRQEAEEEAELAREAAEDLAEWQEEQRARGLNGHDIGPQVDSEIQPEPAVRVEAATEPEEAIEERLAQAIPEGLPDHERETLAGVIATIAGHRIASVEAMTRVPEIEFYVEGMLLKRIAGSFISTGGLGKTALLVNLAIETAIGGSWLGRKVLQGTFVLLSLDDPQEDLDAVLALQLRELKLAPRQLEAVRKHVKLISLREVSGRLVLAKTNDKGHVEPTALVEVLLAPLRLLPDVRCVALDTLRQFAGGSTNDDAVATVATKAVTRLADGLGCCAILPHHTTKEGGRNGTADQYSGSGSGALGDNLRFSLVLVPSTREEVHEAMKLESMVEMAMSGPASRVLRLIDTRGSALRAPVADTFVLRTGHRFSLIAGKVKTVREKEDALTHAALQAVKGGAGSVDAIRIALGKRKPEVQKLVESLVGLGYLGRGANGRGVVLTAVGEESLAVKAALAGTGRTRVVKL
jgi:hypothetical protein